MPSKIILITGRKGVGKDSVAAWLQKRYPNSVILRFADKLKDAVAILYGWDRKRLDGLTPEDRQWREIPDAYWSKVFGRDITPRHVLEFVGTDLIRTHLHLHFWVYTVHQEILNCPPDSVVIIPDCRFWNEYKLTMDAFPEITTCLIVKSVRNKYPLENMNKINKIMADNYPQNMDNYLSITQQIDQILNPKEHASEWGSALIDLTCDGRIRTIPNDFQTLEELHKALERILASF